MTDAKRIEVTDWTRKFAKLEQREVDRLLRIYTAQLKKYIRKDRISQFVLEIAIATAVVTTAADGFLDDALIVSIFHWSSVAILIGDVFVNKQLKYSEKVKALKDSVAGCLALENDWKNLIARIDNWELSDKDTRSEIEKLLRFKLISVDNPAANATIPVDEKLSKKLSEESTAVMNEQEEYFEPEKEE